MSQPISTIHILDSHTANQIAAGEVVERPLSVVKELVENAIDAGASVITVRLFDCGCEKIKVTDNGCGMSAEDMRLAVQRHATSKILNASDLSRLNTLGFRGEALPSIASVSLMSITSKRRDQDTAYRMTIEEGKASIPEECGANNGTTIEVDQLFYNAPARKKFLKSPRTELGLISDYIGRMAICHRDIAFTLMNGNHRIIVTAGKGSLEAAVIAVFGNQISKSLLPVSSRNGAISGLISLPSLTRSTRSNTFFVNGRLVRSKELAAAVDSAYHTLIPEKRYPFTVLFFQLSPESIDVNVHPAKLEIKLHNPQPLADDIMELVTLSLNKNIYSQPLMRAVQPLTDKAITSVNSGDTAAARYARNEYEKESSEPQQNHGESSLPAASAHNPNGSVKLIKSDSASAVGQTCAGERRPLNGKQLYQALVSGKLPQNTKNAPRVIGENQLQRMPSGAASAASREKAPSSVRQNPLMLVPTPAERDIQPRLDFPVQAGSVPPPTMPEQEIIRKKTLIYASLTPIGQFAGTFILASSGDTLYIIDQHAAAERIQYEKILSAVSQAEHVEEMLAVPVQLDLTYKENLLLIDHIIELRDLGFILEDFGNNSYIIRGVPCWLGSGDPQQLIHDYLDYVQDYGFNHAFKMRQRELYCMACRRAVKGNRYLTSADISSLFLELDACRESATCPHGRPIALRMTLDDIYKHFLRSRI